MGPIQRAVRRALNPLSTRVTMWVQPALRGSRLPRGFATYGPGAVPSGWIARRRLGLRRPVRATKVAASWTADTRAAPVAQVVVPDVVGLAWDEAREVMHGAGLVAVSPDPDGPPLAALGWPGGVVVDQDPDPGTLLPFRAPVTLWVERGPGSAGVREPRRPRPAPRSALSMRDEESGESVG